MPVPLADPRAKDFDLVIPRESAEGLFRGRENGDIMGEEEARETKIITRATLERLFRFAFEIARALKVPGGPSLYRRDGAQPLRRP